MTITVRDNRKRLVPTGRVRGPHKVPMGRRSAEEAHNLPRAPRVPYEGFAQ
ncbi:hypothetical protein GCM10009863_39350 [Streptomyces axinellae]|uniref:Uncharacterized protein n=1 Tax=Streptomyces axinellae TaxID=552788 RepID=A0ABP6CIT8_9ACTN